MGGACSRGLKTSSLAMFDGHNDPYEHVASMCTQITIIEAPNSLKCKLLFSTFMDTVLRWYMGLPITSINNYHELVKKRVHWFTASRHTKMSATSLFNICHGPSESLKDYLTLFNKSTIRSVPQTKRYLWRHSRMDLRQNTSTSPLPRRQHYR